MYGKFGRGGGGGRSGGGSGKRNSFPPPHQRISSTGRPSISSRKTSSSATPPPPHPSASASQTDESFSLVSGDPPAFAAIIRLAPDLVDEIKRIESNGGDARIKFDSNPNNSSGNVIDVDGKEFRFTWSNEMDGLCDIYEERQNGVDGNGLLVESGCLFRKLNVQRVLDESTKKQVKKRSEEYEQKQKSRKAIVLDQCNPSMKKQMQDLAAAEASPWKFKQKNKRYFEPPQVGSHPKPVKSTTGFPAATNTKARHSTSPLLSPQKQPISLTSAFVKGNAMESQTVVDSTTNNIQQRAKENVVGSENDYVAQVSDRMLEAAVHRGNQGVGKLDLQNLLVTLLKDNPKGMSLKALEKAAGDMTSSSARKMEPILKKIATYEPPGRYILKSGVELEGLKRSYSDSGSSPQENNEKQFIPEDNHGEVPVPDTDYAGTFPSRDLTENKQNFDHESNIVENFDASQHFSDLFGDDEPPDKNGRAARINDSGSDSDSDSGTSDSGSDSVSRSRSRSLAGSRSASSSDSDGGDSSANSKEASDVDVDIMSDDDKEPKKLQGTEHELTTAPVSWSTPGAMALPDGRSGDQDGYASEDVDIENDYLDDNETQLAMGTHNISVTTQNLRTVSPDHDQNQKTNRTIVYDQEDVEDESQYKHQISTMPASKSKRGSKGIQFEHDADHAKRFKSNAVQSSISRNTGSHTQGSPLAHLAHGINEDDHEIRNLQMSNQLNKYDNADTHLSTQKGNSFTPGKSAAESLQSGRRPPSRTYNTETTDKAFKNPPNWGIESKFQETNAYTQESFSKHEEKGYRDADNEEDSSNDKANGKVNESPVQKHSLRSEPHHRKHSEWDKKSRLGSVTRPSLKDSGKADFDRSPADKRRLQRELSDLELGELRESLTEGPEGTKRQQVERAGSFKQSETKLGNTGSQNAELKTKSTNKTIVDSGYTSPPSARGAPNNSESSLRRSLEPYAEDSSCPDGVLQPQLQQSRNGHAKVGSLPYKAVNRDHLVQNETVDSQGTDAEGYGETQKKSHIPSQHEDLREDIGSHKGKGNKSKKSNGSKDASDSRRNGSNVQARKDKRKRSESASEENTSFTKYEKEEPELKESIKSFPQYKEYVQEYNEKYGSYCSLHKILETYKNEFQKLGMDLDAAKGKERYNDILSQLRERYSQCGARHKRLKKIFLVLHEELKHLKQMIKDFAADYTRE